MNRKEAQEAGSKTYIGSPCKKCGETERYTCNGTCCECYTMSSVYGRLRARKARQHAIQLGKRFYLGTPCSICKKRLKDVRDCDCVHCVKRRSKEYYWENKEQQLWYSSTWNKNNPERAKQKKKERRERNPEKYRIHGLMQSHRRRALMKGGMSSSDLEVWLKAQDKVCFYCAVDCKDNYEIDHFYPLSKGGRHTEENLVIACQGCNRKKQNKDPEDFINEIKGDGIES